MHLCISPFVLSTSRQGFVFYLQVFMSKIYITSDTFQHKNHWPWWADFNMMFFNRVWKVTDHESQNSISKCTRHISAVYTGHGPWTHTTFIRCVATDYSRSPNNRLPHAEKMVHQNLVSLTASQFTGLLWSMVFLFYQECWSKTPQNQGVGWRSACSFPEVE